jgi:hypothetical protein
MLIKLLWLSFIVISTMLAALIVIVALLWVFGYVHIYGINFPNINLFVINSKTITLIDLLILLLVSAAISILPTPFREIAGVFLILWILAVLGIISLAGLGLPSILLFVIVIGLIVSLFGRSIT